MRIVGAYVCSHAGLIVSHAAKADPARKQAVYTGFDTIRSEIQALAPDAIFIVGTDHGRIYTYANLPAFALGVGGVARGIGDAGMAEYEVPVHQPLAQAILVGAMNRGVDFAYSEDTRIDHSFVTPLSLITPAFNVPIVPMAMNCNRPPLVTFARSHEVGRRIAEAIDDGPEGTVVVIGTGGLSHWVGDKARQEFVRWPAGTRFGHEADFPVVIGERGEINEEWDHGFLDRLARGDAGGFISEWSNDRVFAVAGNGAQEVRNWLLIAGMVDDRPLKPIAYEAIPEWHTGIGLGRFQLD
jgi:aromatic ring-opening dioxygenase catalytic subunit (LigB family)